MNNNFIFSMHIKLKNCYINLFPSRLTFFSHFSLFFSFDPLIGPIIEIFTGLTPQNCKKAFFMA